MLRLIIPRMPYLYAEVDHPPHAVRQARKVFSSPQRVADHNQLRALKPSGQVDMAGGAPGEVR